MSVKGQPAANRHSRRLARTLATGRIVATRPRGVLVAALAFGLACLFGWTELWWLIPWNGVVAPLIAAVLMGVIFVLPLLVLAGFSGLVYGLLRGQLVAWVLVFHLALLMLGVSVTLMGQNGAANLPDIVWMMPLTTIVAAASGLTMVVLLLPPVFQWFLRARSLRWHADAGIEHLTQVIKKSPLSSD